MMNGVVVSDRETLASIDIGTNSTRLLVAGCDGRSTDTISRMMRITRLGEGVDKKHELSAEAMDRTLEVLREYRGVMDSLNPDEVRPVATSALRDCRNANEFLEAAADALGTRPEVIAGAEEAALSYAGAVIELEVEEGGVEKLLVFDIGGGSTEVMTARQRLPLPLAGGNCLLARSIDVGCVRMSERFLLTDPPSPVSIGRMESFIFTKLRPALAAVAPGVSRGVGLAGTVTTVSAIWLGLTEYDTERIHHSTLERSGVEEVFLKLASVGIEERKRVMGIEPGRADVIVGGIAVLRAIMDIVGLEELLVSEKDILDGIVLDLHARRRESSCGQPR